MIIMTVTLMADNAQRYVCAYNTYVHVRIQIRRYDMYTHCMQCM